MKELLPGIFIVLSIFSVDSQNLVNNYSFEDFASCPTYSGQIMLAPRWYATQNTPDYFNACANTQFPGIGVPVNSLGSQYASTGNAYAGLLCYGSFLNFLKSDNREYFTGTLSESLTIGTEYYVSFRVSLGNQSSHAINRIGAKFSVSMPSEVAITNSAQVYTNMVITDTSGWTVIRGKFTADSNYAFISIGNHFNDTMTTALPIQPIVHGYNAYYYVDDVCVSADSSSCYPLAGIIEQSPEDIKVSPNPFNYNLNISSKNNECFEVILYDFSLKKCLQAQFINTVSLNTIGLEKGFYIYEILSKDRVIKIGKILKN